MIMKFKANRGLAEAIQQCENIIDLCDEVGCIGAAEDFAASVQEQARDMLESFRREHRVTPRQLETLDNWESGLNRWMERQDD